MGALPGIGGLIGGVKAVPTIMGTPAKSNGSATTLTCVMPAGIVAGETLFLFINIKGGTFATSPSGWTLLVDTPNTGSAGVPAVHVFKKVAVGGEGSASFTVVSARAFAAVVVRVAETTQQEGGTDYLSGGGSSSANPPAVTPSWGADETLWFVIITTSLGGVTAAGAGYTLVASEDNGTNTSVDIYYREATVATEDPAVFTIVTANWNAVTLGIY